jgi:hypothetical protein
MAGIFLENQLQCELDAARAAAVEKGSEESATGFVSHLLGEAEVTPGSQQVVTGGSWQRKVWMIEEVEDLGAKLNG